MQKAGHHVTSFGIVKLRQSSPSDDTGQKLAERFLKLVLISFPRHTCSLSPTEKMEEVSQNEKSLVCWGWGTLCIVWRGEARTGQSCSFPVSLPSFTVRQQLQGSLVLQSILLHGTTSVWLHCSQTAVTSAKSHGLNPVKWDGGIMTPSWKLRSLVPTELGPLIKSTLLASCRIKTKMQVQLLSLSENSLGETRVPPLSGSQTAPLRTGWVRIR